MASGTGRKSLTIEDVEKETTYMGLLKLISELGIPTPDGNTELLKRCLIKHLQQGGTKKPAELQLWDTTSAATNEDLVNRTQLREFYQKAITYINSLPRLFRDRINHLFPNCVERMQEYIEELKSSKCTLLVAGEMGAGKSSLVNLLLGAPILPTSDLRCTAAIVEVSYGELPRAEMYFRDDSSGKALKPIKIESKDKTVSQEFMTVLEGHITKRDAETDESPYEKIQLYWPLEVLKGGVRIVDSPGVGDSESLPQELADYVRQAFGFIYVIDITAAVHKQRLGQLLFKAKEANGHFFDPDTALFVCNRWDMVPEEKAGKVLTSVTERLSMILPGIQKSQLYPISVTKSALSMEYKQITLEHKHLIEGLRHFLPQTLRGKLRTYYRYLSSVLKRSLMYIRVTSIADKKNVNEMHKEMKQRDKKIVLLQKNSEEKLNEMKREVKTTTMEAAENILKHLESMHTRPKLMTWRDSDCPRKDKWQNVLKNAVLLISDRLSGEVNRWEQTSDFEDTFSRDIVRKFEKSFELLSHEVKEIEGIFLSGDDRKTVLDFHRSMKRPTEIKKQSKSKQGKKSKDDSCLSIGAAVAAVCALDAKNSDVKKLFKDKFEKEPRVVMSTATEMCLASLTEVNVVTALNKYFEWLLKGISDAGNLMPSLLKDNQIFLKDLTNDVNREESALRIYPQLSKTCSDLQGGLDMFFLQRLITTDFTADQLKYTEKDALGHGSFATVYKASLKAHGEVTIVALKEPTDHVTIGDVTDVLHEESMLREVDNVNIVKYYGMYRKGKDTNIRLNMVMEYCPYTLKDKYVKNNSNAPSKYGDNPPKQLKCVEMMTDVLNQIISGLCYLHSKSIVHRDLKPENVLLTENNKVKIADLGLAKKVENIVTTAIGTPIYMAPEVLLLSDKYDAKADIYSFGMITWEMWHGIDLANYAYQELQGGLKTCIEKKWRPSLSIASPPTEFWQDLIQASWDQEPQKRPPSSEIAKSLSQFLEWTKLSQKQ